MRFFYLAVFGLLVSSSAIAVETVGALERGATASPQEKTDYAVKANDEMRGAIRVVAKLLADARRQGNSAEQLQCLTNRLTNIRALAQVSEVAEMGMRTALSGGETERAEHEFRKIAVALDKTRQLVAESERCNDNSGLASGDTRLQVEGGITAAGNDTTQVTQDSFSLDFNPPEASPFR